jgi:hypothetical protein
VRVLREVETLKSEMAALLSNQKDMVEAINGALKSKPSAMPVSAMAQTAVKETSSQTNVPPPHPGPRTPCDEHADNAGNQPQLDQKDTYAATLKVATQNRFAPLSSPVRPRVFNRSERDNNGYSRPQRNPSDRPRTNNQTEHRSSQKGQADVVIGTGPNTGLRVVQNRIPKAGAEHSPNRVCIGVFVSRLASNTPADQVERYINSSCGIKLRVEKLHTRFASYSSFLVRCEGRKRSDLMNPDIWPNGALIRPFSVNE